MEAENGIALVTGASSGIGESFARRLAAARAGNERYPGLPEFDELWIVARRKDKLEALATELRNTATGIEIKVVEADLLEDGAIADLEGRVGASGKLLRLLVNNAGYGTYGPFAEVDLGRQLGQIDLNCRVLTEMCGRLGERLDRGALVINVSSLAAFAPLGGFAVYAASKAYVLSFSIGIAAEWEERGIRVCALCPGSVSSEFALIASGGARKEVLHGWSADKTTAHCLRDAGAGKWISMPRLLWRLKRFAGWVSGPRLSARFAYRFMKRPHSPRT